MPLRDFDRVRERIELHLEVRHIVQFALACLLLLGGAFGAGYWTALRSVPGAAAAPEAPAGIAIAPLPSPRPDMLSHPSPIIPKPVPAKRPARRAAPRLARLIEAMARSETVRSATAAGRREARMRSEQEESALEHVANDSADEADERVALARRGGDADGGDGDDAASEGDPAGRDVAGTIVLGETVDLRPEGPDAEQPEAMPPVDPIRPEFVQSLPPVPLEAALTVDSTAIGRTTPAEVRAALPVDEEGAVRVELAQSGGSTPGQPMQTLVTIDRGAVQAFFKDLARREREREAAEKAEAERAARRRREQELARAAAAEGERLAKEAARLARVRAEAARVAQQKAELERLARERAERARQAREKLARERESLRRERDALKRARIESAKQAAAEKTRLAALEAERRRLLAEKAAHLKSARGARPVIADETRERQTRAPRRYYVQIKAFRNESEARLFARLLRKRGHRPALSRTTVPGKGTFFRVRLGPFPRADLARARQKRFEASEPYETMVMWR